MNNGMHFIKLQGIFRNIKLNSFENWKRWRSIFEDIGSGKCFLNKIEIEREKLININGKIFDIFNEK